MKFLADDGQIFESRAECEKYEKEIAFNKLNKRRFTMPFVENFLGYDCIIELYDVTCLDDLKTVEECCKDDMYSGIDALYGFEEDSLSKFTQFPFTAVFLRRDNEYGDLLSIPKEKFIEVFEDFINKLKEA